MNEHIFKIGDRAAFLDKECSYITGVISAFYIGGLGDSCAYIMPDDKKLTRHQMLLTKYVPLKDNCHV